MPRLEVRGFMRSSRGLERPVMPITSRRLVGEVLLLIFGERLRPAMERFVPVLLEVLEAQDGGA